ncbi:hypothetical protein [Amycolatopsis thermoflava]|uniref:hypothetical protein n=1 Tax=Amycolatopsis thermoflava TaxID=84480 RepID=UPI00364DEFA8
MALGAAYASYRHGRECALRFGEDEATAAIWPLIVAGYPDHGHGRVVEDDRPRPWCRWPVGGVLVLHVRWCVSRWSRTNPVRWPRRPLSSGFGRTT